VATKVGDLENIVEDGTSGFVIEQPDPVLIANTISKILLSPETHLQLGKRGREISGNRWRPETIAAQHIQMYKRILSH